MILASNQPTTHSPDEPAPWNAGRPWRVLDPDRERPRGSVRRWRAIHPNALRASARDQERHHKRYIRDRDHPSASKFHDQVKTATEVAIRRYGTDGGGHLSLHPRLPDPRPITFHTLGHHGRLIEEWQAIKSAALDTVIAKGGTVTHHHAVGRHHRPWYDRQQSPSIRGSTQGRETGRRPGRLLNPGVLIDP
jgi:FAD/FMN-containing dehydrogenase